MLLLAPSAPAPVTRDSAQHDALRELSKGQYQQQRPSLADQALSWSLDHLQRLLSGISTHSPGGGWGALLILALVIGLAVVVRAKAGPLRRTATLDRSLSVGSTVTAAAHRQRASEHVAAGRHAEAVRESMRAIARGLDERALVDPRAGRTADEVAVDGGAALPSVAAQLHEAARLFDDIWYGRAGATAADSARAATLEQAVRSARPVVVAR